MRMSRAMVVIAVLGVAVPALAVTVQLENFELPYVPRANGPIADPLMATGYGPPATWNASSDHDVDHVPPGGSYAQMWTVPASAHGVNPAGSGNMYHPSYCNGVIAPGGGTNILQWVLDYGGPMPVSGAFSVTADIKIDCDDPDDFDRLSIDTVFAGGYQAEYLAGVNPAFKAGHVYSLPGLGGSPGDDILVNGQWAHDVVLVECSDFITKMLFFPGFNFTMNAARGVRFYMDDLAVHYVPEPTALLLLGLALPMLRRRR